MARGIYKIINAINNKFYVGSAVDLKRRKTRHFSELRNGRHNNRHLQAAWGKYGEQAFVFVVIEELPADADLLAWFEEAYAARVKGKLDMGKSCIRFKKPEQVPVELLAELCSKVTVADWICTYESQLKR
jgi:group I intron endonuclease